MRWFRMYPELLHDVKVAGLTDRQFRWWVRLLCIACENDGFIPSETAVKRRLNARLDHVEQALSDLLDAGLIAVSGDGFEPTGWRKRQYLSDLSTERVRRHRGTRNVSSAVSETAPDTDTDTDTEITPPHPPEGVRRRSAKKRVVDRYPAEFEAFWQAYPRKVGKAAAFAAWDRFDAEAQHCIRLAAPEFATQMRQENRPTDKIPHAATWINQQRFTDFWVPDYENTEATGQCAEPVESSTDWSVDERQLHSGGDAPSSGEGGSTRGGKLLRDVGPEKPVGRESVGGLAPVLREDRPQVADDAGVRDAWRPLCGSGAIPLGPDRGNAFLSFGEVLSAKSRQGFH